MSETRKVGRPKKLVREDALLRAIGVFWRMGYEGASMTLLTKAMGINSPSLYAEFGDKHGLYLEAIAKYVNDDACEPLIALEREAEIGDAVRAFLMAVIDYATLHQSGAKGCFLASCVSTSAGHIEGAAELLRDAIAATDARITARFDVEKARGALPADFPAADRAKLLFDLRQGLVFRARAGLSPRELAADVPKAVAAVLAPAGR